MIGVDSPVGPTSVVDIINLAIHNGCTDRLLITEEVGVYSGKVLRTLFCVGFGLRCHCGASREFIARFGGAHLNVWVCEVGCGVKHSEVRGT